MSGVVQHRELARGRWFELSLAEQLGNIGGEVHRMRTAGDQRRGDFLAAFQRALELIDLTLRDPRHRERLKEITRLREILCDTVSGSAAYRTTLEDLDGYLLQFAVAARLHR